MTALVFVDTNVLVYAVDSAEPGKQPRAHAWLEHLWRTARGRISTQVLIEYFVTVTAKLKPGLAVQRARDQVRRFFDWEPVPNDRGLLEHAWHFQGRFRVPWWDALILAAARRQSCTHVLSEAFSDGAEFEGLTVLSPFAHAPEGILR
jgi:predicted nucleic acid-binding protein